VVISEVQNSLLPLNTTKTQRSLAMSSEIITQNKTEAVSIPRVDLSIILLMVENVTIKDISDFYQISQSQIQTMLFTLQKKYLPRM
jgi:hypothetical protein